MADDSSAPATKGDVTAVRSDMGALKNELMAFVKKDGEETRRHFDVVAEDMRHDLMGANHDEIELLKDAS
jgi:hypothetical protein